MGPRWLYSLVGIRIQDSFWAVQESLLDWDSESDSSAASAGVFNIGDSIGITAGEPFSTTTRTSLIAGPSSTTIVFIRIVPTSIMPPVLMAETWGGMRHFIGPPPRTHRQERTPARSVDSTMAELREATHPQDSPSFAGFTEAAGFTGAAVVPVGAASEGAVGSTI